VPPPAGDLGGEALDRRADPPPTGDEKATLTGFLDYQRQTLLLKCAGLTPEQLLARSSPPSSLCLLGLLRHLGEVEAGWLCERFLGGEEVYHYGPGDADLEVTEADEKSVAEEFRHYADVVSRSRGIVAKAELDTVTAQAHPRTGQRYSLRWVLLHLIEEYARHNGHADLLREAIDGATGE
jgi:hypothetical protein